MPFSDKFDGPLNQALASRPGWVLAFGDPSLVVSSAGRLNKVATINAPTLYLRSDDAATVNQEATADLLATSNSNGVVLLASGTSGANLNAYLLIMSGATTARVHRIDNNVVSSQIMSIPVADNLQVGLRATVAADGSSTTLQVLKNGSPVGSAFVDTNANRKTAGRRGLVTRGTTVASGVFDNWSDNSNDPTLALTPMLRNFVEGVANAGAVAVPFAGNCLAGATIEARIIDAGGNPVADMGWTALSGSTAGGTFSGRLTGALPPGLGYRRQVRDAATPGTVITDFGGFNVGAIVIFWGQSQQNIFTNGGDKTLVVSAPARARCFYMDDPNKAANNPIAPLLVAANNAQVGNAMRATFNQFCEDDPSGTPLLGVDLSAAGSGIDQWLNDANGRGNPQLQVPLTAGFAAATFAAVYGRWTAEVWMQGTTDVGAWSTYAAKMDQLAALFDGYVEAGAQPPIARLVNPHPRSDDGGNTWNLRNAQYGRAIVPGTRRWQLGAWLLNHSLSLASVGEPHQQGGVVTSNRMGRRVGRRLALLVGATVDPYGPRVVRADFVDATRQAIDVLFDRDIRTPAGVTAGLPGHFLSTNNGSSWPAVPSGYTAAIVGARTLRLTSTGGAFPLGLTRYDLLRGTPFANDPGSPDYVGPEEDMEASFLSRVITDTTAFDDNAGNLAVPVMGTGLPVALPIAITATDAIGSATLRVRQA